MIRCMERELGAGVQFGTPTAEAGGLEPELCLESEAVRISPTDYGRRMAIFGICALAASLIHMPATLAFLFLWWPICLIWVELGDRPRPARVRVKPGAGGELVIERRRTRVVVKGADIVNCWT